MAGAVNTTYTFTATDVITSAKMNNILQQSYIAGDAIIGTTLEVASSKLKVRAQGITSNELSSSSVTTAKIADSTGSSDGVTTAKIADGNITAAKLASGAVVGAIPSNFPIQIIGVSKTDVQTIAGHATDWYDVTGLSITLTRAVASASGKVRIQAAINTSTNNANHGVAFRILRGTDIIGVGDASGSRLRATSNTGYSGSYSNVPAVIDFIDSSPGSSSTVLYKIQAKVYSAATGYINRPYTDTDTGDYQFRTISTMTLTELSP